MAISVVYHIVINVFIVRLLENQLFEGKPFLCSTVVLDMKYDPDVFCSELKCFNPISTEGGGAFFFSTPYHTVLHCTKTDCNLTTKPCDFLSNLIGN